MFRLASNWITEPLIDFEYKSYLLKAYLRDINKNFDQAKLFPYFNDLSNHLQLLQSYETDRIALYNSFRRDLKSINFQNLSMIYENSGEQDFALAQLNDIVEYSIKQLAECKSEGHELLEDIRKNISLFPIGLIPLNKNYGYLLFRRTGKLRIYSFEFSPIRQLNQNLQQKEIRTHFIGDIPIGLLNSYENVKDKILKENNLFGHPAIYAIESNYDYPQVETLMPIVKNFLITAAA